MKTKFYEFNQNNSGGYFDVDNNVCHRVIIEALDEDHAQRIFEPMIEDQSPSCPCCGERWWVDSPNEIKLEKKQPEFETLDEYLQWLADKYGWTIPDARIHFLDGTKKEIFSKKVME